jgi:zinc/manganese transport system substrate-binding protein
MRPFRGAPIVQYHRTLTYLVDWLGLEEAGYLEPKPGIPPNPQHVARLLANARARKVRAVVLEEHYPESMGRLMAEKIPAAFLEIPGGASFQAGQSYTAYLEAMVGRLADALEGRKGT